MLNIDAKTQERWEDFRLQSESKAESGHEILLYGPIIPGEMSGWMLEGDAFITNKIFRERLNAISGDVVIRINSPGGDVYETSGIVNLITERRNSGDRVDSTVDGLSASAASMVMVATEKVRMASLATIMIHSVHAFVYGSSKEFRKVADYMDSLNSQFSKLYAARMDLKEQKILDLLEEEQWYSAEEAVKAGLGDEIITLEKDKKKGVEALFKNRNLNLAAMVNLAA